ncbi:MAG: ABC transporter ATP-binding protein [Phycisphaerae bacterium]
MSAHPLHPLELEYRHAHPLRTLWHVFSGERKALVIAIALFLIKQTPGLAFPLLIAEIINQLAAHSAGDGGNLTRIFLAGAAMVILVILNFPAHAYHSRCLSAASRHVEARLRGALVQRLQQLSMAVHDQMHSGHVQSKVLRDVESIHMLCNRLITTMLYAILTVIVALIVALLREPLIALLFVAMAPFCAGLIRVFRHRMRKRNREFRGQFEQMSSAVSEMIEMIPVTRAHGVEEAEVQRVDDHLEQVKHGGMRLDLLNAIFVASTWTVVQLSRFAVLGVAGWMVWNGRIPIGDLVLYELLFVKLLNALTSVLNTLPMIHRGFESIRSLGEIMECPDLENNQHKQPLDRVVGRFEFQEVRFTYPDGDAPAIDGIDLTVPAGQTVALVGPSGSGKSTMISLLLGFRRPGAGRILLDGTDMQDLDLRTFRREVAVVGQQTILFSGTIAENIAYGLDGVTDEQLATAIHTANLEEVIALLPHGPDTVIGEHGGRLSGGQRQRLAIARAVVRDPKVIFLDEATSSLDVISEVAVQTAIDRLVAGRTTFIVAHRLSTIRHADRVLVLQNGRIVEDGTQEQLLEAGGEFHRLKTLQG